MYGRGLCFGMATVALLNSHAVGKDRLPLAGLPLTQPLLDTQREHQRRQFRLRPVLATVRDWMASGGGRPDRVLERLSVAGEGSNPQVLCFGPALNWKFFSCLARAHAVCLTGSRVYVYDPNHPRDRDRFVEFWRGGAEFAYDGFRSREGWGITLVRDFSGNQEGPAPRVVLGCLGCGRTSRYLCLGLLLYPLDRRGSVHSCSQ